MDLIHHPRRVVNEALRPPRPLQTNVPITDPWFYLAAVQCCWKIVFEANFGGDPAIVDPSWRYPTRSSATPLPIPFRPAAGWRTDSHDRTSLLVAR